VTRGPLRASTFIAIDSIVKLSGSHHIVDTGAYTNGPHVTPVYVFLENPNNPFSSQNQSISDGVNRSSHIVLYL